MKKRAKTLIILLCVLAVVAGGIVAATLIFNKPEEPAASSEQRIFDAEAEDVTEISFTTEKGSFDITRTEDGYVLNGQKGLPVDSGLIDSIGTLSDALEYLHGEMNC